MSKKIEVSDEKIFWTFLVKHSQHCQLPSGSFSGLIGGSAQVKWKAFGQVSQQTKIPVPRQLSQKSLFNLIKNKI